MILYIYVMYCSEIYKKKALLLYFWCLPKERLKKRKERKKKN